MGNGYQVYRNKKIIKHGQYYKKEPHSADFSYP